MMKLNKVKDKITGIKSGIRVAVSRAGEKAGYNKWPSERKRKAGVIVLLVLFFLPFSIRGCSKQEKEGLHPRPVQTALAVKKDVPIYLESFGQMVSTGGVDIKSQVTGKILEVAFTQGKEVEKGELLFVVDPAPYQAQLDKAEALLAQNTAIMQLKSDTLERNKLLFEKELISRQEIEEYQTEYDAAVSTVKLNKAEAAAARIDLDYCEIRSPVKGLTGKRMVDPGNIVSANSGPTLVNVSMMDELYVDFSLAERYLSSVRLAMGEGTLAVEISVPGSDKGPVPGKLDLVDNTINNMTGSFSLRASMDNKDRVLWPGQFVNIRLILGTQKDAIIVPYASAKIGKQGYYVFTVDEENTADLVQITVGSRQNSDIVVEKGLKEGDVVVTKGQLGLRPGIPVVDISKTSSEGTQKPEKRK